MKSCSEKIYLESETGDYKKIKIVEDPGEGGFRGRSGPLGWKVIEGDEKIPGRNVTFFGISPTEIYEKYEHGMWRDIEKQRKLMHGLLEGLLQKVEEFRKMRNCDIVVMTSVKTLTMDHSVEGVSCNVRAGYTHPTTS